MDQDQKEWFYEYKGNRVGPVDESSIISLIKSGELTYGDDIWAEGYSDWIKVEESKFKQLISSIPPPLKSDKINNFFAWALAFSPIIGEFIRQICLFVYHVPETFNFYMAVNSWDMWWVPLILNIILFLWDAKKLKLSGIDVSKFIWWALFLIPVYLYKRAKYLKQDLWYFATWFICFVVAWKFM